MTGFRWIHIMKCLIDILKKANCSFSYNYQTYKITTTSGDDITPHLFAVFERIDKIEDEYWREKIAKSFNLPVNMLFPEKEKVGKYNFIRDKKPRVYISGPITGRDEKEYKNDFNSTELWLTGLGYDVVNPISDGIVKGWEWADYMRRDIIKLCSCDYIYFIGKWEDSKGCCLEFSIASQLGIKFLYLDENGVAV